jgi:hypothetical protein
MSVKKVFQDVVDFLQSNADAVVSDLMPTIVDMCSNKRGGDANVLRNSAGEVVAIFCSYHKKWEMLDEVEFGLKTSSVTGYNNMCKEGLSNWTKQQNAAKKASLSILEEVEAGTLAVEDIAKRREEIEAERSVTVAREDGKGYDTLEELRADVA